MVDRGKMAGSGVGAEQGVLGVLLIAEPPVVEDRAPVAELAQVELGRGKMEPRGPALAEHDLDAVARERPRQAVRNGRAPAGQFGVPAPLQESLEARAHLSIARCMPGGLHAAVALPLTDRVT